VIDKRNLLNVIETQTHDLMVAVEVHDVLTGVDVDEAIRRILEEGS
jgi:hypothetical protein